MWCNTDEIFGKELYSMWESGASFWNAILLYIKPTVQWISFVLLLNLEVAVSMATNPRPNWEWSVSFGSGTSLQPQMQ